MKTISTVALAGAMMFAGTVTQTAVAAQPAAAAQPAPTVASVQTYQSPAVKQRIKNRKKKRFFKKCRKTRRFNERQANFGANAILGGRCATSKFRGIKFVGTYAGHQPSASRALDLMVNRKGSCRAGRKTGNKAAKYLMRNSGKLRIQYIIWKNRYWQANWSKRSIRNWQYMGRGGSCTTKHYDHIHVAFR